MIHVLVEVEKNTKDVVGSRYLNMQDINLIKKQLDEIKEMIKELGVSL